ncbi:MAG TPA: hypothetical protein VHO72_12370, partial [Bacteroidales bacterium]|nr:hypothetical protein [Bacteroidales bacterium]
MDNLLDNTVQTSSNIQLDSESINHLNTTQKWTKFIAIVSFVVIGLMILGIFIGIIVALSRSAGSFETGYSIGALIPMLAIVAIYFFPIYYLYMFSKHMKLGIQMLNSSEVNLAFKYLKLHYRFMGILIIVVISIYIVVIIAAIAF